MDANAFALGQGFRPGLRPDRMIGEDCGWIRRAADDKMRMKGAARRCISRLVTDVHAPAHAIRIIAC